MSAWPLFWTILFFVTLSFFAVLVLVVAIKGFGDIKTMLRRLKEGSSQD